MDEEIDPIKQLHREGIFTQDILALQNDLRPCIRFGAPKRSFDLKKILSKLGLKSVSVFNPTINNDICFIGKDLKYLKQAAKSEMSPGTGLGRFLGYPECCIKTWNEYINKIDPMPLLSALNTKSQFHYQLNYLFTPTSRGQCIITIINKLRKKLPAENPFEHNDKYLVPHIPCSFDCRPSIAYADKLEKILLKERPEYLEAIKNQLKNPFLFIDEYDFLIMSGTANKNSIFYNNIIPFCNLFDKKIAEKIQTGNKIVLDKESFSVFKDKKLIKKFSQKARIFNFV